MNHSVDKSDNYPRTHHHHNTFCSKSKMTGKTVTQIEIKNPPPKKD